MLVGILIGLGLVAAYIFVLVFAAMLGIPLETRKGREKRAQIAQQLRDADLQAEAERQIRVEQIKRGLRDA
jgi:hypothetical protein